MNRLGVVFRQELCNIIMVRGSISRKARSLLNGIEYMKEISMETGFRGHTHSM